MKSGVDYSCVRQEAVQCLAKGSATSRLAGFRSEPAAGWGIPSRAARLTLRRRAVKTGRRHGRGIATERRLELATRLILAATFAAAVATAPVLAAETPKRGGTLTYLIAADAPPSFDAHREQTYAVIQPIAP